MTAALQDFLNGSAERPIILAIEGGANRAAYTAGMAAAFEDADLTRRVKKIYGISSGAFVGAALAAGKARQAAAVFINTDMRRFMTGAFPRFDLDLVFDAHNGLLSFTKDDYRKIASEERLCVVAYRKTGAPSLIADGIATREVETECSKVTLLDIGQNAKPEGVVKALKAGAHFPCAVVGADLPEDFYDGAIVDNNGILSARAEWPDAHVIALTNRPWGQNVNDTGLRKVQTEVACAFAMIFGMGLKEGLKARKSFKNNLDYHDQCFTGWYRGQNKNVFVLAPPDDAHRIVQEETDAEILGKGVFNGIMSVYLGLCPDEKEARKRAARLYAECKGSKPSLR